MDKPNITWIGSPNHNDPKGYKMIAIVDHIMAGTLIGTDSWFLNPASKASSHFGVGKNGDIHQYVDLKYPAWANGIANKPDWPLYSGVNPNYYTISIEHEGYSGDVMTEAQYQSTLALHRWLVAELGIPVTRDNIIGHYRIDSVNKSNCPGSGFPWDRLFEDLKGESDVLDVAVLLNTKDDFWAGVDVAVKNGNCAVFVRGEDRSVPKDAKSVEKLFVIGGATVGHPNEVLLSGNDKYDTAAAVKRYLG
ncbi:N-acetylmuramoyl-L-alanine amidase [Desulfosporosinus fructosivorans]|uniref:N-acetylmuramoyl-L-alanine amidase n=1 Tax=Desulfosporosinus fructosivorans TaxID=2018669 RepID=A0A4Z0R330_9FIRM|nr:N-acetylmuramoyl-L-alanine amidase [Desulfosporosinus fructosivorans]TGE36899.1 N-acetylmuramoyl-L-alanine amidase [Desulfosporosinus fructosivorans]